MHIYEAVEHTLEHVSSSAADVVDVLHMLLRRSAAHVSGLKGQ